MREFGNYEFEITNLKRRLATIWPAEFAGDQRAVDVTELDGKKRLN